MKRINIQLRNEKTGESLTLPINPETIDIENAVNIDTYNILGYGEVAVSGYKTLQRINLSNILPSDNTFFSTLASLVRMNDFKPYNLKETIDMFNRWVDNQDIIRIIISDRLNKEFRLERYTDQVRESVEDSDYTIEAIEYRNPAELVKPFVQPSNKLTQLRDRVINKFIPNKKVMTAGMTIYKLAKLTYGGRSEELAKLNSIVDRNADLTGKVIEMLPL